MCATVRFGCLDRRHPERPCTARSGIIARGGARGEADGSAHKERAAKAPWGLRPDRWIVGIEKGPGLAADGLAEPIQVVGVHARLA